MNKKVERNYLEITSLKDLRDSCYNSGEYAVEIVNPVDFQLNKFFYKNIGKNHNWVDRLVWTEKIWIEYVSDEKVQTYVLKVNEDLAGYFEQIFYKNDLDCEIAYFGVLEEFIGKKYGGYLLSEAIKESFNLPITKGLIPYGSLTPINLLSVNITKAKPPCI